MIDWSSWGVILAVIAAYFYTANLRDEVNNLKQRIDGAAMPGLLPTIGPQIDSDIASMEKFDAKQVHLRNIWLSWPNIPSRMRDNILAAEPRVSQLENLVADGGQLQQMAEQVAERKAGSVAAVL